MISRARLRLGAQEWGVGDVVVENDYVLGWLLWGIGSERSGSSGCSRAGRPRFSQDLDFTVRNPTAAAASG